MTILENLSDSDYRQINCESYSSLKYLLDSPKVFKYYKEKPFKGSNATLLGTAIHHYLQGNRHLVAISKIDKRKKEEYLKFETEFRDLAGDEGIIVPASFEVTLNSIMTSLNSNKEVAGLLEGLEFEVPLLAEYKGMKYKAKVDGVGSDYLLEIKSSSQATNAKEFKEEAEDRHYDLQAAMYLHAANRSKHYFIVVNTVAPYKVQAYKSSVELLLKGKKKLDKIVDSYKTYIVDGKEYIESAIEEI